jgi:glycogen debranching enzyme
MESVPAGFFEFAVAATADGAAPVAGGWVRVEPEPSAESVPLAAVSVQTLVTKCLGTVDEWDAHFETARRCGYNAVHLTPVQPLGISDSAYCLFEQLDVSQKLFAPGTRGAETADGRIRLLHDALGKLKRKHGQTLNGDVVLPHSAANSGWLATQPDAAYSLTACPYLMQAFVLDCGLQQFSAELADGKHGSPRISSEGDITRILEAFKEAFVPKMKLWEFYVLNIDREMAVFAERQKHQHQQQPVDISTPEKAAQVVLAGAKRSVDRGRNSLHVDLAVVDAFTSAETYRRALNDANLSFYREYDVDTEAALTNLAGQIRWEFLLEHGPHRGPVTRRNPLARQYFTIVKGPAVLPPGTHPALGIDLLDAGRDVVAVVNHGWVMNAHPFLDFAGPESRAYARRDVIVWEDSVKLRYGTRREDNPWLWDHQASYVRLMASMFDGFRIDNSHSVPLPTLQYLLAQARAVNPKVIIFAELFAPSWDALHHFTASCGMHALLCEAARPGDLQSLQNLFYDNCGAAVAPIGKPPELPRHNNRRMALPIPLSGWIFDLTHDNEPFSITRTTADSLSTSALVAMCATPTGSVRGLDELLPFRVDVVTDKRLYRKFPWSKPGFVPPGIMRAKALLGRLHEQLALKGYSEAYVQCHGPLITIARQNPVSHSTVHLLALPAFKGVPEAPYIPPLTLSGVAADVPFVCSVTVFGEDSLTPLQLHPTGNETGEMEGLASELHLVEHPPLDRPNTFFTVVQEERSFTITFSKFPPGSVLCIRCEMTTAESTALATLTTLLSSPVLVGDSAAEPAHVFHDVPLEDMNVLLFRSEPEEVAESGAIGMYDIPSYGKPAFAGLQGW